MSVAFTREEDLEATAADLADRPISPHPNLVTAEGLAQIEAELASARAAYAAVAVELDVDKEVRLRRVWCAVDAGLVINPDGAKNQVEGGIVHAISMTLKEQVAMDGAGITSLDWANYPILKFSEVPDIVCDLVHAPDLPTLGMGECTFGPTAAAIGKSPSATNWARCTP